MKSFRILVLALCVGTMISCSQDFSNRIERIGISFSKGNYKVSVIGGETYFVKNDKVTSEKRGYYFFYDKDGRYIQVPINLTVIEQMN